MIKNRLASIRAQKSAEIGRVISQREFAGMLGVNYHLYNRWERQVTQPNRESLMALSSRLDCRIEDIIYEVSE